MVQIIRENALFFYGFLFYLIFCVCFLWTSYPGDLIVYFSDHRSPFGDFFFKHFTKMGEGYLYIFFALVFFFKNYRYTFLIGLTGFSVLVISFFSKLLFAHERPFIFFSKIDMLKDLNTVEGVELYVGHTSFPSGHTMSAFAMYGIVAFLLKDKKWLGAACILAAILVGISRIYLVQHFVKDVFAGAISGVFIALALYYIFIKSPFNKSLQA